MSRDRLLALLNAAPLTTEQRKQVFTDFRDAADYRDFSQRLSQTLRTPATARLGYDISTLFKEMQPTNPDGTNMSTEDASMQSVSARYPIAPETPQPSMVDRALRWASVSPIVDTDAMRSAAEQERERLGQSYVERAARGEPPSLLEAMFNEAKLTARFNAPAELLDVVTNPAQLLARATGVGGAAATALNVSKAAKAAQVASQANRAIQSGLDVAQVVSGANRAISGDTLADKFAGAAQVALGGASLGLTRRPELATTPLRDVPDVVRRPSTAQLTAQSMKNLSEWQRSNKAGRQKYQLSGDDWSQHVEPALALYMKERNIDPASLTNDEIAEAMRWYVGRVEQDFDAIAASNPNTRVTFNLAHVKQSLNDKFSQLPADRNEALAIIDKEFASLKAPKTLADATALRKQLTGKISSLLGQTGSQQYYATQSSAAKAAYDAMVDEVRDALFKTYDNMGVKTESGASAQDVRRSIRSAIQVRDRTELSKELGQQRVGPLPRTLGQSVVDNVARNASFLSGFLLAGGTTNPVVGATAGYTAREAVKNLVASMRGETLTRDEIAQRIAQSVAKSVAPAGRPIAPPSVTPPPVMPPTGPVYAMTRTMTGAPMTPTAMAVVDEARNVAPSVSLAPVLREVSPSVSPELPVVKPSSTVPAVESVEITPEVKRRFIKELDAIAVEAQRLSDPVEAQQIQDAIDKMRTQLETVPSATTTETVARTREEVPVAVTEPTPAKPKAAVKAGIGADAPGKKIPFVAAKTSTYDPETSGSIVAEFIDFPLMPTHRFVVGKLPTGWAVLEYSTGKAVSSAQSSKAKAIKQATATVAALKNPQQALESEVVKYPVLNTAFPARREE